MATGPGQLNFQDPTFDYRNPAVSAESQVTQLTDYLINPRRSHINH